MKDNPVSRALSGEGLGKHAAASKWAKRLGTVLGEPRRQRSGTGEVVCIRIGILGGTDGPEGLESLRQLGLA